MAIQDEMYKDIIHEIDSAVEDDSVKIYVNYDKAKDVAKMLTGLSTEPADADTLTNQYIAQIKNICK